MRSMNNGADLGQKVNGLTGINYNVKSDSKMSKSTNKRPLQIASQTLPSFTDS